MTWRDLRINVIVCVVFLLPFYLLIMPNWQTAVRWAIVMLFLWCALDEWRSRARQRLDDPEDDRAG